MTVLEPNKNLDTYHFIGLSECFEYFIVNDKIPLVTIHRLHPEVFSKATQKEVIKADLEVALDIISWVQKKPIEKYKTSYNTTTIPQTETLQSLPDLFFERSLREKDYELLAAHRQILNQGDSTARYLMSYRLLEAIAAEKGFGNNVENLLLNYNIKLHSVKNRRNPKQKSIYITYVRDKIHPTKKSFMFPISDFRRNNKNIAKHLAKVISEYLK